AAGAEHDDEPAFGVGPQRLKCFRKRIGFVGIVDKDLCAVAFAHPLQPALGALQPFEACEYCLRVAASPDRKPRRDECVLDLKMADQRQPYGKLSTAMFERKLLRKAIDFGVHQADALARPTTAGAHRD